MGAGPQERRDRPGNGLAASLERWIGSLVELAAAGLVVLVAVVLGLGVTSRYVFGRPLTWSDEVVTTLFLWLAMLGATVAYRRLEHMRMGVLVDGRERTRTRAQAVGVAAELTFLLLIIWPAVDYAIDEAVMTTPSLGVSGAWRASALPAGISLMVVLGFLRMVRAIPSRNVLLGVATVLVVATGLFLLKPAFAALGNYKLLVFFVLLVGAAVFSGIPIAFAFGLGTVAHLALTTRIPMTVVIGRMDEGMSHLILVSVPLFVLLGALIEITGMARTMVGFLASLLGHVRGGLHYVLVAAMYLVSGISGSKAADMAAVAPVLFPEMRKRGADEGDLVALLSATGAQTETVPPSLVLITIGSVTGVSIGALFTGGLVPALVLGAMLCLVIWWQHRRDDLAHVRKASLNVIGTALLVALPALVLPFLIRAAVVEGVATATEVSTIGIAYVLVYGVIAYAFFGETVRWSRLGPALVETASLSGAILLIIGAATAMAWALTQSGFSRQLTGMMTGLPGGGVSFMLVSVAAFVVLGSVLEGIPAIVLFGPLMFPIAKALGIHEVHYAIVVILAMGIGLFAPPFGVGYYAACAISRIDPARGLRPIMPYMLALLAGTILVAAVPWFSTGFLSR